MPRDLQSGEQSESDAGPARETGVACPNCASGELHHICGSCDYPSGYPGAQHWKCAAYGHEWLEFGPQVGRPAELR
ncbi:MAG TPA: hypothetical protein VEB21_07860 [Terriglobales bacterium]|nr:hypothetical protein [Terriglobales bacterium]